MPRHISPERAKKIIRKSHLMAQTVAKECERMAQVMDEAKTEGFFSGEFALDAAATIRRQEKRIQELEQVLRRVFPEIKPTPPTLSNYKFLSVTITVADLRAVEAVLSKAQD
jgi:hypothetical protein